MLKLTKIRLINWHYLENETITLNGSAIIAGDNGAGKSTVVDAIQFVLTTGKMKFNKAAHSKTKRDLKGYVRCKTGKENKEYERSGNVTSHVALEFQNGKKSFVVGVVIDSASDMSDPKKSFYYGKNKRIKDQYFLEKGKPFSISDFKKNAKFNQIKVFKSTGEARKEMLTIFGRLDEKFIDILSKSVAFEAMDHVRDFVYYYLLDEKEVNIECLRENIRTYLKFEELLKVTQDKMRFIEEIREKYGQILNHAENIEIAEYVKFRSKIKEYEIEIERIEVDSVEKISKRDKLDYFIEQKEQQAENLDDEILELNKSLLNNDTFNYVKKLEDMISKIKIQIEFHKKEKEKVQELLKIEINKLKKLKNLNIEFNGIGEISELISNMNSNENIEHLNAILRNLDKKYENLSKEKHESKAKLNYEIEGLNSELNDVEIEIKKLNQKQLSFPPNVELLRNLLDQELSNMFGTQVKTKVLCELLEIKDPKWKNAIEGYLNTQKFNLILEPKYFDAGLRIYEKFKNQKKIFGVGLVNIAAIKPIEISEGSLATVIDSRNSNAKKYADFILRKVMMCDNIDNLKKHLISITDTCMVYKNYTARQLNPSTYKTPYIGSDAYKTQLELKNSQSNNLKVKIAEKKSDTKKTAQILELLERPKFEKIIDNSNAEILFNEKVEKLLETKNKLSKIDQSSILLLGENLKGLNAEKTKIKEKIKTEKKELQNLSVSIALAANKLKESNNKVIFFNNGLKSFLLEKENVELIISKGDKRYIEGIKKHTAKKLYDNFELSKKRSETLKETIDDEMIKIQNFYNTQYHFGGEVGLNGVNSYLEEYRKLKDSELLDYEENIKHARTNSENEFKESFVARLRENIVQASREFKKLNNALKDIYFGNDSYEFKINKSKEYSGFYEMIMDENNLGGETLFSADFNEKHKEAMEELFKRISSDQESSKKELIKFTDYRTFMDYDIKIIHDDNTTSSFAKVCREKSGGETQTPYYVAIAASFVQMYTNPHQVETIKLMLLDEAFNRMDDTRIDSMMQFLKNLGLQVIIAAPPQKIDVIAPYVSSVLIIEKEDNYSWIEGIHAEE